ncbi:uncharacterized protein MYCFIDRAFT_207245 [Pseudocercospora fijiensis CIRAD86]|uniref:FAD-binding domain-containing protein n=1 Tax=Pseudocercospora fijiensis (strain CIRAD86) TaxID=383855 RepID=M3B4Q5_PSEFD|nr:uncharacterized protein MYCFIDRAFT_207245 [Pseudocercospora fijiensis CIRAD86]EME84332.1 hypothetical protein MYCFIDRAFT_207245 [Pseudocercospora fijiensis CIRAD86]
MPQPPIAILGAGPAGLTLARLLEQKGFNYVVFERDSHRSERPQGGSLDIHVGSGQLAVKEAGLWDDFLKFARYDAPTTITDKNGKVALRMDPEPGEGVFDRPEIDRTALRNLLLDSIPASKIQWGRKVSRVSRSKGGTTGFQLVVGADVGCSSPLQPTCAEPIYEGLAYLATSVEPKHSVYPKIVRRAEKGSFNSVGSGKMLTLQYTGDGLYNMYIGLKLPESWAATEGASLLQDPTALRKWLIGEPFADWAESVTDVIRDGEGGFRVWSLGSVPLESLNWTSVAGVTLVGDAAHVTYPNGEGVNNAMHDSLQLARKIEEFGLHSLDRAVVEYEQLMLPRAREHVKDGVGTRELMFGEKAPEGFKKLFDEHLILGSIMHG